MQKDKWNPTKAEIEKLKAFFEKNPCPKKHDKRQIIECLRRSFSSSVQIDQLNRWFQNQRERTLNSSLSPIGNGVYKRFNVEQLKFLQDSFAEEGYPKLKEMKMMAQKLSVSFTKVENWFKQNRRALAKQGCFTLKPKKYFNEHELLYLEEIFEKDTHPMAKKIIEIFIEQTDLTVKKHQVKNWFSNRRKKVRSNKDNNNTENFESKVEESNFSSTLTLQQDRKLEFSQSNQSPRNSTQAFLPNEPILSKSSSMNQNTLKYEEPFSAHTLHEPQLYPNTVINGQDTRSCNPLQIIMRPVLGKNFSINTAEDNSFEMTQPSMFSTHRRSFDLNGCSFVDPIKFNTTSVNYFPRGPFQINITTPIIFPIIGRGSWLLKSNSQDFTQNHIATDRQNTHFYF